VDTNNNGETYNSLGQLISRVYSDGYTQTLHYNGSGQLQSVTDSYNRTLTFTYNTSGTLASVLTPDNTTITYGYTTSAAGPNLTSVTYPTSPATSLTYVYNTTAPYNALTEVIDENNNEYLSWTYDSFARALTSTIGNGSNAQTTTFSYNDTNQTTKVTNPLGVADTYSFTNLVNMPKVSGISRAATSTTAAASRSFGYDSNGFLNSKTDWNGNQTTYVNNAYGLPTTINEAVGTSVARTTTIVYDPTCVYFPDSIATPGVTTSFAYDSFCDALTSTQTDTTTQSIPYSTNGQARTTTFTYNNFLLASVESPNLKTTYLGYSGTSALTSIKDPLNHITNITSYTGGGLPETVVDPNNVTTTIVYDPRQRITSSSVSTTAGALNTTWEYFNDGDVTTTLPDGSARQVLLDSAHRLAAIADNYNEQLDLTLDSNGDPVESYIQDRNANTPFDRTATYDALGRKLKDTSLVTGASIVWTYDNNGNPLTVTDQLSHKTTNTYDALNRLSTSKDASGGTATITYDAYNRPLTVKDKNGHTTTYVYDGFGDLIQQASPDSGTTVYHYDPDANLTSRTDAASVVTNWTYDALDRPLTTTFPADSSENVTLNYDQTGHGSGIGRLTSVTDAAGSLSRTYDQLGNVLSEQRTNGTNIFTTTYTYDKANRVASITYPSGAVSSYTRDAVGQVTQMPFSATNSDQANTAYNVTHLPFGPVNYLDYNNGDYANFTYDVDYRLTVLNYQTYQGVPYFKWTYGYDNANNVKTITDAITSANSQTLGYDTLNRLTSASSSGTYGTLSWNYDHNNNLTSWVLGGVTYTDNYTSGTNRLASITWPSSNTETIGYTATGSMNSIQVNGTNNFTLGYNNDNRLISASGVSVSLAISGATYDYAGRRITKSNPGSNPTVYTYDLDGNLIEENDNGAVTDYIFMDGINIANWEPSEKHVYMVNFDARGVPQVTRDGYGLTNWAAYSQPYGGMTQTVFNGQFTGPVTQNLRLPGQYFDHETTFHYNGFRDYIPALGRYIESDPIGLGGGLNNYAYASGNPLAFIDPIGLEPYKNPYTTFTPWTPSTPGRPLNDCEKQLLAPYVPQIDLDNARIHEGEVPSWLPARNGGITLHNDIFFRPGFYSGPTDPYNIGFRLGHELKHVTQWRTGDLTDFNYAAAIVFGGGTGPESSNWLEVPAYAQGRDIYHQLSELFSTSCTCVHPQ
jgi:RHS repeat-associated protein